MESLMERAKTLGNALAGTEEYRRLRRAITAADDDRQISELKVELERLEGDIQGSLRQGKEPEDEVKEAYELAVAKLQANTTYQALVAAQMNFDKVLQKVNETISTGIEEGAQSKIILA